jgi:transcription initiation factor TFIIH subunit 4
LGLIFESKKGSKFYVSKLMSSFLQSTSTDEALEGKEKFLIVETNFKVYAYTSSELNRKILGLFMKEQCRFENLICGILTRDSLK